MSEKLQNCWFKQPLNWLGETHVGYHKQNFSLLHLSVVGGRSFSWGGFKWRHLGCPDCFLVQEPIFDSQVEVIPEKLLL